MSESKNNHIIGGIILIALGAIFLFSLNIGNMIGKLWPLILIALGVYFIYKTRHRVDDDSEPHTNNGESGIPGLAGDIRVSGLHEGVGSISKSLLLGDVVIDLTGSKLLDGENTIDVSVLMGDITIMAPADFPMKIDLNACIGDLKYREKQADGFVPKIKHTDDNYLSAQAKLHIKGRLCVGNIKILTT